MCFRYVGRAGHYYGPVKPVFKYELYGPLHKTRCVLAEAGQPKGMTPNAREPFELPFTALTSPDPDLS